MVTYTDNQDIEDRIIPHIKCPDCGNTELFIWDLWKDDNGQLLINTDCGVCAERYKAGSKDIPIRAEAKIEVIQMPNRKQMLFFHVYEVSRTEDSIESHTTDE